ncbi:hypothetical protein HK104_010227 [Borealophlyctis nickersoniae]|nr:hypothetical protein HK104_010227 [Borealophlyctis nickersoniae]
MGGLGNGHMTIGRFWKDRVMVARGYKYEGPKRIVLLAINWRLRDYMIQQQTYNNVPTIERKRKAVDFATCIFKRIVCEQDQDGSWQEANSSNDGTASTFPSVGELVGTRRSDGSAVFAKIIRTEGSDAVLMLLKADATRTLRFQAIGLPTWDE